MEPTAHHLVNPQDTDESQSLDLSLQDMEPTSSQLKLQYEESDESEDTVIEAKDEGTKGQIQVPQTEDDTGQQSPTYSQKTCSRIRTPKYPKIVL